MTRSFPCLVLLVVSVGLLVSGIQAQTTTVIPANEAAAHVGEYATVEGIVAKVFTSNKGNTFLNIGAAYPNQTFTGWIPPASPVNKSPILSGIEGCKEIELNRVGCEFETDALVPHVKERDRCFPI